VRICPLRRPFAERVHSSSDVWTIASGWRRWWWSWCSDTRLSSGGDGGALSGGRVCQHGSSALESVVRSSRVRHVPHSIVDSFKPSEFWCWLNLLKSLLAFACMPSLFCSMSGGQVSGLLVRASPSIVLLSLSAQVSAHVCPACCRLLTEWSVSLTITGTNRVRW
jgi:hypothetical protein